MLGEDFGVKKVHTINRRMFIIGVAKIIVFTGIIARLFSLQITDNKKYLTLSDKNRLREWRLPPVRGEYLDYFGKKQILLVDTIYKIKRENPSLKIKLELIGNGENFKIIKKKIKQNNLQNEIILTESLPEQNLKKWFSNIDLYCHLSVDEGLSTAILHALSNKTLLLVTKNDGNKFLKNHAFFTKNNLSDVSQKIIYISNNMHLFNKRIDKAFKFLQKKYSSNVMFESYKKEFIKLCAKKN